MDETKARKIIKYIYDKYSLADALRAIKLIKPGLVWVVLKKKIDVEIVTNELKMLAEDKKSEMSANVYEYIWNMIQGLEKDGVSK